MFRVLEQFFESISNPLIVTDAEGRIIRKNRAATYLCSKLTGRSDVMFLSEIDPEYDDHIPDVDYAQTHLMFRLLKMPVEVYKINVTDNVEFLYVFKESVVNSELLDTILDLVDDAIGIVNSDGIIENFNKAFFRITNYNEVDILGRSVIDDSYSKKHVAPSIARRMLELKQPLICNESYKNGRTIMYSMVPIFDESGEFVRGIGTGRDVTELMQLEVLLREAERANVEIRLKMEELKNNYGLEGIIYSSESMRKTVQTALKAAKTDASIFLWGESGTGKEEIAKLIHNNSQRKEKPFIPINCAAIPSELLESELFGYVEGAFTGSKKSGRIGLLEEGEGGSIFLDEIGELPLTMQSKLLRVIQENSFMRVGDNKLRKLDVRYISATNLTKKQLADRMTFRQDLYYRLSIIPIHLSPLRERREDILPLVRHFLTQYNTKYNLQVNLSKSLMELFYQKDWLGNVRELKNTLERLVILSEKDVVDENDFYVICQNENEQTYQAITISKIIPLKEAFNILEEIMVNKALKQYGSIVKAAQILGINPCTIHRKAKKGDIHLQSGKDQVIEP